MCGGTCTQVSAFLPSVSFTPVLYWVVRFHWWAALVVLGVSRACARCRCLPRTVSFRIRSVPFRSVPFRSVPFHSIPSISFHFCAVFLVGGKTRGECRGTWMRKQRRLLCSPRTVRSLYCTVLAGGTPLSPACRVHTTVAGRDFLPPPEALFSSLFISRI